MRDPEQMRDRDANPSHPTVDGDFAGANVLPLSGSFDPWYRRSRFLGRKAGLRTPVTA
jgi:hypothetical protein